MSGAQTALAVAGAVVVGLALLVASMMRLAGRTRPLQRALRRLRLRAEEAEKLQLKVTAVQARVDALQDRIPR